MRCANISVTINCGGGNAGRRFQIIGAFSVQKRFEFRSVITIWTLIGAGAWVALQTFRLPGYFKKMLISSKKLLKGVLFFFLLTYSALFLAQKIDLTTADLGRHLKNGELVFSSGFDVLTPKSIFNSNFYSYTNPNYPFVNHHWLSGVIFFMIKKVAGFGGLSWFYLVLSLTTFCWFFVIAKKQAGFKAAFLASLLLIPLLAQRAEIRPEIFGYLFGAVFLWLLLAYQGNQVGRSWLWLLPVMTLFWVNLHISFFIGIVLIGIFWLRESIEFKRNVKSDIGFSESKFKWLTLTLIAAVLVSFLNPNTWRGALYPLKIFENYGYRIVENQSIWFLEKYGLNEPNLLLFEAVFGLLALSFIFLFVRARKEVTLVNILLSLFFSVMAWLALRNLALFGFFMLPVLAFNLNAIIPLSLQNNFLKSKIFFILCVLAIVTFIGFNARERLKTLNQTAGAGVWSGNSRSASFFMREKLAGPIFNNYDIGSFLIYYLYPKEKVFVDNRPEAYPADFFEDVYIPMQEDESEWIRQDQKYNFNAIFFGYHDLTLWAQDFLAKRINDPVWAPVYADAYAIIFLKRNQLNQLLIRKYEISKDNFQIIKQD